MKTTKLYLIGLAAVMIFTFSQQSVAQDFYSSPGYSRLIDNLISNHIWNSSMEKYTKQKNQGGSGVSKSKPASPPTPYVVPEYRRYPAVQFKSTGTRLFLQELQDAGDHSAQEKAELKELLSKIFKEYETAAAAKGYPNDLALAFVSCIGLSKLVYYGTTEDPSIPFDFEQNTGLRDIVAKNFTDYSVFDKYTDLKKQQLYEDIVSLGALAYHQYKKSIKGKKPGRTQGCQILRGTKFGNLSHQAVTELPKLKLRQETHE